MERKCLWPNMRDYADMCRKVGPRTKVKPITSHISTRAALLIAMFCRDLNKLFPGYDQEYPSFERWVRSRLKPPPTQRDVLSREMS